jgi:hypothetical protein
MLCLHCFRIRPLQLQPVVHGMKGDKGMDEVADQIKRRYEMIEAAVESVLFSKCLDTTRIPL